MHVITKRTSVEARKASGSGPGARKTPSSWPCLGSCSQAPGCSCSRTGGLRGRIINGDVVERHQTLVDHIRYLTIPLIFLYLCHTRFWYLKIILCCPAIKAASSPHSKVLEAFKVGSFCHILPIAPWKNQLSKLEPICYQSSKRKCWVKFIIHILL